MQYTDNASPHSANPIILVVGDGKDDTLKVDLSLPPFDMDFKNNPVTGLFNVSFNPIEGTINLVDHTLIIKFSKVLGEGERCSVRFFLLFDGLK